MGGKYKCCGRVGLKTATTVISGFMLLVTIGMISFAVAYDHAIFFFPLVLVLILYDIIFVYHRVVPGEDRVQWRVVLFLLMCYITLGFLAYGILVANQIYNNI